MAVVEHPSRVPSEALRQTLRAQEGFSFNEVTQKHARTGVFASEYGSEREFRPEASAEDVEAFRRDSGPYSMRVHVGAWSEGGRDVLDRSHRFKDVLSAKQFGRANLQEAVFDLDNFETHWIDYGKDAAIPEGSYAHVEHTKDMVQSERRTREGQSGHVHGAMADAWNEVNARDPLGFAPEEFEQAPEISYWRDSDIP